MQARHANVCGSHVLGVTTLAPVGCVVARPTGFNQRQQHRLREGRSVGEFEIGDHLLGVDLPVGSHLGQAFDHVTRERGGGGKDDALDR